MSEFEEYIEAKYPNRSPKILFQKFKDIDGTLFYGVKEIEDQAEVWQHQQDKIDDSENTRAVLYRENTDLRERNIELQKRVDVVLKKLEGDFAYVEQDQRKNFEFLQMAMIRCLKDDIKALRGEHD